MGGRKEGEGERAVSPIFNSVFEGLSFAMLSSLNVLVSFTLAIRTFSRGLILIIFQVLFQLLIRRKLSPTLMLPS